MEKKLEEKGEFEALQKIYHDRVMNYKLSKALGQQYYSTMFKPITEKLEDVAETSRSLVEPIRRLKELSEEQSERMLPPPVVPAAIADVRRDDTAAPERRLDAPERSLEYENDDDDEFEEAPEDDETKHKGPEWKFRPDENVSEETLKLYKLKPPSIMKNSPMEEKEEINKYLTSEKGKLTKNINKMKSEGSDTNNLEKMRKELDNYTGIIFLDKLKVVEGKGCKMNQYGQYGSSYIDIPLLKKRRILFGRGNPLLSGKVSKDCINLITKRFNSKKKYKGSSIETFKLLNKLSSMPINKRSKKIRHQSEPASGGDCRPIFYDDPRDLVSHLDLILGSIEAGYNNKELL